MGEKNKKKKKQTALFLFWAFFIFTFSVRKKFFFLTLENEGEEPKHMKNDYYQWRQTIWKRLLERCWNSLATSKIMLFFFLHETETFCRVPRVDRDTRLHLSSNDSFFFFMVGYYIRARLKQRVQTKSSEKTTSYTVNVALTNSSSRLVGKKKKKKEKISLMYDRGGKSKGARQIYWQLNELFPVRCKGESAI